MRQTTNWMWFGVLYYSLGIATRHKTFFSSNVLQHIATAAMLKLKKCDIKKNLAKENSFEMEISDKKFSIRLEFSSKRTATKTFNTCPQRYCVI